MDASRAEPYSPVTDLDLFFELGKLSAPADALPFVRRFGLLRHGPGLPAEEYREPWHEWEAASDALATVLLRHRLVRRAIGGEQHAVAALWEWQRESRLAVPAVPHIDTLPALLNAAVDWLGRTVNRHLEGATVGVLPAATFEADETGQAAGGAVVSNVPAFANSTGLFLSETRPRDLLGYAWVQCVKQLLVRASVADCLECGRPFTPADGRQRYCSPRCQNRAGYRRWADKKRAST